MRVGKDQVSHLAPAGVSAGSMPQEDLETMAFTGDLENLPIVEIIQLIHTTRKSGIFSVKGSNGESRLVFSNGHIVGANHIDNSVRIGTVLVKTGAITVEDLKQAMGEINNADEHRMPLLATLVKMGKLKREDA